MGFYIFGIFIYYYGFFIAIGVSIAFLVGLYLCKKFDTNFYDFLIFSCSIALFAIVGAKTTYIFISYKNIDFSKIIDFRYISYLMRYGFVFYGGVLFAIFGYFFIKKYLDIDKKILAISITLVPLVHAFGRIGCFFTGCCYGIMYNSRIFSKIYKNSKFAPNNISLFPVQLVESFCNILIFFILLFYILNIYKRDKKSYALEIYLSLYATVRFILEYFRGDLIRGKFLFFSTSQWISIFLILFVIFRLTIKFNTIKEKKS